ncbi:MAG: TonB-dependent receptor [Saprospiraceae bacterium]
MIVFGQCDFSISGIIIDKESQDIMIGTIIKIDEHINTISNLDGSFRLENLCANEYEIKVYYIGKQTILKTINLQNDTTLNFELEDDTEILEEVVITGPRLSDNATQTYFINQFVIDESLNENLSTLTEKLVGVSTLKNGSTIGKPIVQGLYGNRLSILNNGISQSGQQWGNDHAPEIDPFSANRIYVFKGVSALEYQGSALGSIVMTESYISSISKLNGFVNSFFESNGRGFGINAQVQNWTPNFAWKINGTIKKSGDKHTPNYFLNNTGNEEANLSLELNKKWNSNLTSKLYFSSFNTSLGVLRGSHISNLTDLELALSRDEPYFTEADFSYEIEAPKQQVNHHLLKLTTDYEFVGFNRLTFTYAAQLNNRKEFDVRRSGRTDIPALSLRQLTNFFEAKYKHYFTNNSTFKTGVQLNIIDNENNPETGILPLIPDYLNTETSVFATLKRDFKNKFGHWEVGARYDNVHQSVATFTQTTPREVKFYNNLFNNFSFSSGFFLTEKIGDISGNIGFGSRNPAINELYSFGLHQGISSIEEGNIDLETEKAIKSTLTYEYERYFNLNITISAYYQHFQNYIFLNPQDEYRLTIRGAFPVFQYAQTNAQIYGLDAVVTYYFNKKLKATASYSFIKGNDLTNNLPLINIPSNNLLATLRYGLPNWKKLKNNVVELNNRYVFEQRNLLASQDFVLPPNAYNLVGAKFSTKVDFDKTDLKLYVKVDNLFNVEYRDYLNRQRYFADDLGRNIVVGANVNF